MYKKKQVERRFPTKTFKEGHNGEHIKILEGFLKDVSLTLADFLNHLLRNFFLHRMNRILGEEDPLKIWS